MHYSAMPVQFRTQELVPESLFKRYGHRCVRYLDPRLLEVLGAIRIWLDKPMIINNWHGGGDRQWSGIRTPDSPHYSLGSAHSWGMAFDAVGGWEAATVRAAISSGDLLLPHPVRLEINIDWLHVDVMNIGDQHVEFFKG